MKRYILIAGVNGAGKSTLYQILDSLKDMPRINTDEIIEKVKDIYLLIHQGELIGSIACYGNEIDDLIVNKKFQHKGYGKQLLLWGMLQSIDDPAYIKLGETELYYCICCQY